MRKTFIGMICALGMAALSARADAATANFQGNCAWSGTTINCVFDAQRPSTAPSSCPGSYITWYDWAFGDTDNTGDDGPTTSSFMSHSYTSPHESSYQVDLTVHCNDGSSASLTRWVCVNIGFPGCVYYSSGWN